jgi:hypothetical protein
MKVPFMLGLAALIFALPEGAQGQEMTRPEILILGTYHMANPGRDVHNLEVDDVLSPTRQGEIAQFIDVLRRFRPTKIAVEAPVQSSTINERYESYLAGGYTLSRNEIDQVGLRLAKTLNHAAVYSVDVDGEFPYYRVLNYAKANGLEAQFDSLQASVGDGMQHLAAYMSMHTVLETLELVNADSSAANGVGGYYGYVPFGEPYEYAGPDLIARWFETNIRIYRNIRALITSPTERVLVIYGYGHLGWLRQMVNDDPSVQLRKLSDLTSM